MTIEGRRSEFPLRAESRSAPSDNRIGPFAAAIDARQGWFSRSLYHSDVVHAGIKCLAMFALVFMGKEWVPSMPPIAIFFLLVFVLSLPIWVLGALIDASILPGLPVAAVAVAVPTIAASIATVRMGGWAELRRLFARTKEVTALPLWGWAAALSVPFMVTGSAWIWRLAMGQSVVFGISPLNVLLLASLLIATAILEEIGWTGFATDRLTGQFGLVTGAHILGTVWSIWHFPAILEAHRGFIWIGCWAFWTVGQRVAMVALHYLTGRNFAAPVVYHATANIVWQSAPNAFHPLVEAIVVSGLALALCLLAAARPRNAQPKPVSSAD